MRRAHADRAARRSLKLFLIELLVYALAATLYFFVVLHFLDDWLTELFAENRRVYAAVALGLIVGQGFLLELLTRTLLQLIQSRLED